MIGGLELVLNRYENSCLAKFKWICLKGKKWSKSTFTSCFWLRLKSEKNQQLATLFIFSSDKYVFEPCRKMLFCLFFLVLIRLLCYVIQLSWNFFCKVTSLFMFIFKKFFSIMVSYIYLKQIGFYVYRLLPKQNKTRIIVVISSFAITSLKSFNMANYHIMKIKKKIPVLSVPSG